MSILKHQIAHMGDEKNTAERRGKSDQHWKLGDQHSREYIYTCVYVCIRVSCTPTHIRMCIKHRK